MRRYLFGPVSADFADQDLRRQREAGHCLTFNGTGGADLVIGHGDTWEAVCGRLPADGRPDFIALNLAYTTIPLCLGSAPVPRVGLARDWHLLWHHYRHWLPRCELVLTDSAGVEALFREGMAHARPANLAGCRRALLEAVPPDTPRDIDILFVGNLNPAVQRERMAWLGRLARLGRRWRVAVRTGVWDDAYRDLLHRARIVFNRSSHRECNPRAFEAAAAGALLFQEADNREVPAYFRDRQECVYYTDADLEVLLEHYLEHEAERRTLAEAARARVTQYRFEDLWEASLGLIEREWPGIQERVGQRPPMTREEELLGRCWQALGSSANADPSLVEDLKAALAGGPASAALHNALGLAVTLAGRGQGPTTAPLAEEAVRHFQRAVEADPLHLVARLNLVEALVGIEQAAPAIAQAREALYLLDRVPLPELRGLDEGHFPPAFDGFRVEWERAAWAHAGNRPAEAWAKRALLRWRLHTLLGELTDNLAHRYEAVLSRPDLPATRAALGCALARAGQPDTAVDHLGYAVAASPFDRDAARALYHALGETGDGESRRQLVQHRRLLARAAPQVVPPEAWFAEGPADGTGPPAEGKAPPQTAPAGPASADPRVSLCLIVKDEEANLPACLDSAADLVDEIVVVDTGSTDRTKEIAAGYGARVVDFPWVDSFAAARNEGLRHATGQWIFWLDADDRLDEDNRRKLKALFAGLKEENAAYVMKCLCLPDPASGTATVVDHVRLFRNHPELRWEYRVHEQILPALRRLGSDVRWADVVIHHAGYQDPALRGRKLERDLRLLQLEDAERPDDPFTLFNLGSVYQELDQPAGALAFLQRSLEQSHPSDSIVRKLYALIAQCHRQLDQPVEALAACRAGREHYPDDTELLFLEGLMRREQGDLAGAEACLLRLLQVKPGAHFASVDAGLSGYKARHNLAVLYHQQGRAAEAEAQWREAVAQRPDFVPAWLGLGELYLAQGRWEELGQAAEGLQAGTHGEVEAMVLRARGHLARKEFAAARQLLEDAVGRAPQALGPRLVLSHVLLQEGRDWAAAERALRGVLALDPDHAEARNNLAVLLGQQDRVRDEAFVADVAAV